jgi:hypothetical protein
MFLILFFRKDINYNVILAMFGSTNSSAIDLRCGNSEQPELTSVENVLKERIPLGFKLTNPNKLLAQKRSGGLSYNKLVTIYV